MQLDKIIRHLRPNAEFVIYGDTLQGLEFIDQSIIKPTQTEIELAWLEIQKAENETAINQEKARQALLNKLNITEEEAKLLLS